MNLNLFFFWIALSQPTLKVGDFPFFSLQSFDFMNIYAYEMVNTVTLV